MLSGVGDAHSKHSEAAEPKGVKAHFRMDESGILLFEKVMKKSLFWYRLKWSEPSSG